MQYLLSQLAELNIKIKVIEQKLHINAPTGVMTKDLAEELKQHKQDLIKLITGSKSAVYEELPKIEADYENRFKPFPLTAIQHAYWMGRSQTKIELGGVSTHLYFESETHNLDIRLLQNCFNTLVQRHDMLRVVINDNGIQQVLPEIPEYEIQLQDLSKLSEDDQQSEVVKVRERMSHQVLETKKAPVIEIFANKFSENKLLLHFSLDMLVLDAWSMMLLFKELHSLYQNPAIELPPIDITYRDYALAEEKLSETAGYQKAKKYWWGIIDDLPPAPQIPLRSEAIANPPKFSRRRFRMPKKRWEKLQALAKARGVMPTGLILSAFTEVLTLWSSTPHYTLNVTLFNRQPLHPQVNNLLGDFTSLLLLEVDHRQGDSFVERMAATQSRFMRDLENRAISGLEVMRELRRRRSAMMEAAMPVVFTGGLVYSGDGDDAGLLESFGPMVYGVSQTPQVSLDHQVMEVNGDLVCNWDCVDEKFLPGMLDDLYNTFCQLLNRLVDDESAWFQASVIDIPDEQRKLRNAVNATDIVPPCQELLHTLFIKQALSQPHALAIVCHDGKEISYGELLAMANDLAQSLISRGVGPEVAVAVLMNKGWEQITAVLAIHISGAAYLPISSSFPTKRQNLLIEQGGATIVLTQPELIDELDLVSDIELLSITLNSELPLLNVAPEIRQSKDSLAYILFTSGTTGTPKGVMIEHRNAVNTVFHVNQVFGVNEHDRVLAISALNFDLSVYDVFGTLGAGGVLVLPSHKKLTDPEHWLEMIDSHRVTLWNSAPALMGMLVDHVEAKARQQQCGHSLRMVWLSGDKIPVPLPNRVHNCFINSEFISLGGPTETSIWSIYHPVSTVDPNSASIPYGKPLPNQHIYILNKRLQDCPAGVAGTIYVGGEGVGRGYLCDKEKTNDKFIAHPISGERLYDSGDLGKYMPDGNIEILGRSDFQVKIRGYRIELGEITAALLQHDEIKYAVAMPVTTDDGSKQIIAYVVAQNDICELADEDSFEGVQSAFNISLAALCESCNRCAEHNIPLDYLDKFYSGSVLIALSEFGIGDSVGRKFNYSDIELHGMKTEYHFWMQRALYYLSLLGFLKTSSDNHDEYEVVKPWSKKNIISIIEDAEDNLKLLNINDHQIEFLNKVVTELSAILKGEFQINDVLYLGASRCAYFQTELSSFHRQVVDVIQQLASTAKSTISLLEVGAGIGALSSVLAPAVSDLDLSYLITDPEESHLEYMFENLAGKFENIDLGLFDPSLDTEQQGLFESSFDLIVSSMTLWKTAKKSEILKRLHKLLKKDGFLLLVEPKRIVPSLDICEGLLSNPNVELPHKDFNWYELLDKACFHVEIMNEDIESLEYEVYIAQARAEKSISVALLKKYLGEYLPDYMIPHHIVTLETLPVSVNGKVDYKALPLISSQDVSGAFKIIKPRDEIEQTIHDSWMVVIKIPELGVNQDFFDVGGDSLLAARVVREINERIPDFNFEMFEFFEHLTIELQAQLYTARDCVEQGPRKVENVATSLKLDPAIIENDVRSINEHLQESSFEPRSFCIKRAKKLLLTGATGWLGAYLLFELLNQTESTIVCLGRSESVASLRHRILKNLHVYSLEINENQLSRIQPVLGDITQENLGVDQATWCQWQAEIDGIYHAAAAVGITSSYVDMRSANLSSVTEIAKLSLTGGGVPIFFCSSVALLIRYTGESFVTHKPETPVESAHGLIVGYAQSKWAAEQVLYNLIDIGVPVKIFRIAHVLPDTRTCFAKGNYIFESVLTVARTVHALPVDSPAKFYGIPVDIAGRALVESSLVDDGYNGAIHMDNKKPVDLKSLLNLMFEVQTPDIVPGLPLVSTEEWLEKCRQKRQELPIEAQAILNFLLEPTEQGTMFEALYNAEPSCLDYLNEHKSRGGQAVEDLTNADYWAAYFKQKHFVD